MGIKNIVTYTTGHVGVAPRIIYIETDDTVATVTASGYLNKAKQNGWDFSESDMALVSTKTSPSATAVGLGWYDISISGSTVSLTAQGGVGAVTLPTIANYIAHFSDTVGTSTSDAANVINAGNIQAGLSGTAGSLLSYSSTASKGYLALTGVANTGDTATTISNAAMGQASVISIPDPGAATANFLLDTGAANILAMQQFVGVADLILASAGTWTPTRVAQGDYVLRHTAADDTSILAFDITPMIRVAASKGFRLDSFDVMYSIASLALDAHSVTLDRIEYANNTAVSVNSISITGTLATATQANPYLTNVAVDSPAFDVTADSKYVIELTVDAGATSDYDLQGFMLRFSQTIG